jgi:cytochrome c oxidase accessory protein FixG
MSSSESNRPLPKEEVISLYKSQGKIQPRGVEGYFSKLRWLMVWLTQIYFYGMPWLQWGGRQAMLFDLDGKRFYIYGLVLYPQDLIYLTAILIISALSLFLFTAVAGRLWCGFTCPQTVYTEIFMWIESKIEGNHVARKKLDDMPWTPKKFGIRSSKHLVWLLFAFWTGFTFVGYFTPIRDLFTEVRYLSTGPWETFWLCFYTFATYGNAGFMREQVCKYMCPYARFQSAMFDKDTLIVSYDKERGEPRGGRSSHADHQALGDCIDCHICVQVCPTGIDIREGLQYECISCGACADACNSVMDKVGYPKGLIKFTTENALTNRWSKQEMIKRIFRVRVLIYGFILSTIIAGVLWSLTFRNSFRIDVVRDRGVMARLADGGMLENVYRLNIMNALEEGQHYKIYVEGLNNIVVDSDNLEPNKTIAIKATESRWIPVRVQIPDGAEKSGSHKIMFRIESEETHEIVKEKSTFIVPRN